MAKAYNTHVAYNVHSTYNATTGTPPQTIFPDSITTAEAFGTPTITIIGGTLTGDLIDSGTVLVDSATRLVDSVLIAPVTAFPSSITSTEAFGVPKALPTITVQPTGILTGEVFGSVFITATGVGPPPVPPPFRPTFVVPILQPPQLAPAISPYRVVLGSRDGTPLGELPATNLQFSYTLNAPGSISFVVPIQHPLARPDFIKPAASSLFVYRNEALVWSGILWDVPEVSVGGGVSCTGDGWFSVLRRRYIDWDHAYKQAEQFDIVWDMISTTQAKLNGDLGITRWPETPSGNLRDWTFNGIERRFIADVIDEMSAMAGGFDFEITPQREWKTYYPSKGTDSGIVFDLQKNIGGLSWQRLSTSLVTEVTDTGSGSGKATLVSVASDDVGQLEFGLLEATNSYPDVTIQKTLDDHAAEDLRASSSLLDLPQFQITSDDPSFGAYVIGDVVHVVCDYGYLQIDQDYRLTAITVAVSNEGRDNIGLFFDKIVVT